MRIPYYHVDAFTTKTFGGNPAGVCILERWPTDEILQRIAAENNLAMTAFLVPHQDDGWQLRWFMPVAEMNLCGHATLAAAFILFEERGFLGRCARFHTRSGCLTAERYGGVIEIDFQAWVPQPCPAPELLARAFGRQPCEVLQARDYLAVFDSPSEVAALAPDMSLLAALDSFGVVATARGEDADFVSRFFAPRAGIPEDSVTGSAHASLIPFWAGRLGKTELFARQISHRGGELYCRLKGDRVGIGGRAVLYGRGELEIPV